MLSANFQLKVQRNLIILAAGLFAVTAVDYAEDAKTVLVTVLAIASALNLLAFLMSRYFGSYAGSVVNLANTIVSVLIAVDMYRMDKLYLPYIWLVIALVYALATIVTLIMSAMRKDQ